MAHRDRRLKHKKELLQVTIIFTGTVTSRVVGLVSLRHKVSVSLSELWFSLGKVNHYFSR